METMTLEDLARAVTRRWANVVVGAYAPPACPTSNELLCLLATANYAAGYPEEGRYPKFNITATSADSKLQNVWRFDRARPLAVAELRRLIPGTDYRKSAVHIEWSRKGEMDIVGIHDLGTSWHRAKIGIEYQYTEPPTLLIEVERPNRLGIYQGPFRVASFVDGEADTHGKFDFPMFLHEHVNGGLNDLAIKIHHPKHEPVREYAEFEFLALWNCYAAIANLIASAGHGGTVIVVPTSADAERTFLRRKYAMRCPILSDALVSFLNARHAVCDLLYLRDAGNAVNEGTLARLECTLKTAFDQFVEGVQFVAQFAECDGAVVLTRSLEVLGFGCEVAAELRNGTIACEVVEEMSRQYCDLDVEQFGMRHRSAVKLASQLPGTVTLVISQDGPISAVWSQAERVYVRKGVRLVNANLPWA